MSSPASPLSALKVPVQTPQYDQNGNLTRPWALFYQGLGQQKTQVVTNLKSPLDFGAAGDGVTDDTAAVAQASALGYLWLPTGSVFVTAQLTVTQYGWTCFGGGALLLKPGEGTDLLYLDGSQYTGGLYPGNGLYAHITNVVLNGNASQQPINLGACLALRNAAYTTVTDCLIYAGSGDGIRLENYQENFNADECNLIHNRIFSNGRHGIYLLPTLDAVSTTIAANISPGARVVTPASMANIHVGTTLVIDTGTPLEWVVATAITPTTFTATFANSHTGPGIAVNTVWGRVADHIIAFNHCNYNGRAGIRGTRPTSVMIVNNNVLTNAVGIELDAADHCNLLGNYTRNNKGAGIIIEADQSGNGFGRSNDILIEGNGIHYNGVTTTADELDVFNCDAIQIKGNFFGDVDFGSHAQYGIQLYDCTGVVIEGNDFENTVHGPLLAPINPGTGAVSTTVAASIAAGTVVVTPASMTNITLNSMLVVSNADGSDPEFVSVTAVTSTTFTATFTATKTGPGILVKANPSCQQPYRPLANIGLSDEMQATQASLPFPAVNDYGLICRVNDYGHRLLWIGTQWVFCDLNDSSGAIVYAPDSILTGGVWAYCNPSTTVAASIATGSQVVTPASMSGITVGMLLWIANYDASNAEFVTVTAVTSTTFTATFTTTKTYNGISGDAVVVRAATTILNGDGTTQQVWMLPPANAAGYWRRR